MWPSVPISFCCLCTSVNYEVIWNINIDEHCILYRLSSVVTFMTALAEEARLILIVIAAARTVKVSVVLGCDRNLDLSRETRYIVLARWSKVIQTLSSHTCVIYVRFLPYIS